MEHRAEHAGARPGAGEADREAQEHRAHRLREDEPGLLLEAEAAAPATSTAVR